MCVHACINKCTREKIGKVIQVCLIFRDITLYPISNIINNSLLLRYFHKLYDRVFEANPCVV